jgi:hypothetical protein
MKLHPRFSLRTLAIVVTLVCAYLGAWEVTKRHAAMEGRVVLSPDFRVLRRIGKKEFLVEVKNELRLKGYTTFTFVFGSTSPAPFVVARSSSEVTDASKPRGLQRIRYDIWLFGLSFRTPFESQEY